MKLNQRQTIKIIKITYALIALLVTSCYYIINNYGYNTILNCNRDNCGVYTKYLLGKVQPELSFYTKSLSELRIKSYRNMLGEDVYSFVIDYDDKKYALTNETTTEQEQYIYANAIKYFINTPSESNLYIENTNSNLKNFLFKIMSILTLLVLIVLVFSYYRLDQIKTSKAEKNATYF